MEEKVYFLPGDVVTVRQLSNSPEMLVVKKSTKRIIGRDNQKSDYFQGMLCRWFTLDGVLQEAVFNTKDLEKKYGQ